jgi:hypothetical protein
LCAIFRTLLADQDGLYDPTDYNDRLLLGLKGTMSEAEIHILRGRMYQAMLNKARRGELYLSPPIGYIRLPAGEFAIDPDEQVQSVVRLIFDLFARVGTVRGVVHYLVDNHIRLPLRPHRGPNRGSLQWRRATRHPVQTVLTHPIYEGTYCYGRRQIDPRRKKPGKPGSGRVVMDVQDYHALIPNHCPGYISPERYARNQQRIKDNRVRTEAKGPPREGPSLLGGLVMCARCERRMIVQYCGAENSLRYACQASQYNCGPACQSLSGWALDQLVAEKIFAALEPAVLELSLAATDELQKEREQLEENWRQRLERGRYEAERVERQYQAVEPENRLVARELERRWEAALREHQNVEQDFARFRQSYPATLTTAEREAISELSKNFPRVWKASTTTMAERQRIVRLLLERVVVNLQGTTDRVDVTFHWAGGYTSQHELIRPVRCYEQMADYNGLVARIEQLRKQGQSYTQIAEQLNLDGFHPPRQTQEFNCDIVGVLVRRINDARSNSKTSQVPTALPDNEWRVIDLARRLKINKTTLLSWIKQGWVHVARRLPGYRGRLICWANEQELDRLCRLRETKHGWWDPPLPAELKTPNVPVD